MKIRTGFVSNSCSASFHVDKEHLTEEQLVAIRNHIDFARDNNIDCYYESENLHRDEWNIFEDDEKIGGNTSMDNFEMHAFLKAIGVCLNFVDMDSEKYLWEMEKKIRADALDRIRKKKPIQMVNLPFEYHEKEYVLGLKHRDYRCACPNCGETVIYYSDIWEIEPIESAIAGEKVTRCADCKSYFVLLEKTGEVSDWKWGHITREEIGEIDKIIDKVGL